MLENTFLVELGTEELPPTELKALMEGFAAGIVSGLEAAHVEFSEVVPYATPRRLAVQVKGIAQAAQAQTIEKLGPAKSACFDEAGNLTKTAEGWLKACGISIEQATFKQTDKNERISYTYVQEGQETEGLLFDIVERSIKGLKNCKYMRWGDLDSGFIRPVHTLTMLFNDKVVDGELFGVKSSNVIFGHRFQGEPRLTLEHASQYEQVLIEKGSVIPCFAHRLNLINEQAHELAKANNGYINVTQDLLEEITSLVEFPNVLLANYEKEFLEVPKEALIHTMEGDQRYFPLFADAEFTTLAPHFVFVANINPQDPSLIIAGNEKVIRPRLTDAKFFYEQDLKTPLESLLPRLRTVVFQQQLGTVYDKTVRIKEIAAFLANKVGVDVNLVERAALLAKCDLMTNMVFEITETQGTMGMYYARKAGEHPDVAQAIFEQYLPRFAGDQLPATQTGSLLSLADKLDTLVGIFGINQIPKGAKDPFALRRATIGILRILVEGNYDLDIEELVRYVIFTYEGKLTVETETLVAEILKFVNARYDAFYEGQVTPDVLQAVTNKQITNPHDFDQRLQAVAQFKQSPSCADLVAGFKRVNNILSKAADLGTLSLNPELLSLEQEKVLHAALLAIKEPVATAYNNKEYVTVLTQLATLRLAINDFFDHVIVNDDNPAVRSNRYALLAALQQEFSLVADISALVF